MVSEDNRVRIYFAVTETGDTYLQQLIAEYYSFTDSVNRILSQGGQQSPGGQNQ